MLKCYYTELDYVTTVKTEAGLALWCLCRVATKFCKWHTRTLHGFLLVLPGIKIVYYNIGLSK